MTTLRAYGAESSMLAQWQQLLDRRLDLTRCRARLNALSMALLAAMAVATPLIILVMATSPAVAHSSAFGQITPGTALASALLPRRLHRLPRWQPNWLKPQICGRYLIGCKTTMACPNAPEATTPANSPLALPSTTSLSNTNARPRDSTWHYRPGPSRFYRVYSGSNRMRVRPHWLKLADALPD